MRVVQRQMGISWQITPKVLTDAMAKPVTKQDPSDSQPRFVIDWLGVLRSAHLLPT
jgi:predicted 3-demethylubiquinone-9 3-methyltransferase (glyoxalase superfamily)